MRIAALLVAVILLPVYSWAQPSPPAWVMQIIGDRPFGQATLLAVENDLNCAGSALTPPNAEGERTKIWDPGAERWMRMGFGEGRWVWIVTTPGPAPSMPRPCTVAPVPPPPLPPAHDDFLQMHQDHAELMRRLDEIAKRVDEPAWYRKALKFFRSPEFVVFVGSVLGGHYMWPNN